MEQLIAGQSVDYLPDEYIDYLLCKTFHCLPSYLNTEDDYVLQVFLEIIKLEWKEEDRQLKQIKSKYG